MKRMRMSLYTISSVKQNLKTNEPKQVHPRSEVKLLK